MEPNMGDWFYDRISTLSIDTYRYELASVLEKMYQATMDRKEMFQLNVMCHICTETYPLSECHILQKCSCGATSVVVCENCKSIQMGIGENK